MGQRLAGCVRALATIALLALSACGGGPGGNRGDHPHPGRVDFTLTVTDEDGQPIADSPVLFGTSPYVTDARGQVVIPGLLPGLYNYTVQTGAASHNSGELFYGSANVSNENRSQTLKAFQFGGLPRVSEVSPLLNQSDVPLGSVIYLTLSHAIDPATLESAEIQTVPDFDYELTDMSFRHTYVLALTPLHQLPPGLAVLITISGDIRAADGRAFTSPMRFRFVTSTTDDSPPRLVRTSITNPLSSVYINSPIRFDFNEATTGAVTAVAHPEVLNHAQPALDVTVAGSSVLVSPVDNWDPICYFLVLNGVSDGAGNVVDDPNNLPEADFCADLGTAPISNIDPEWNSALDSIVFATDRLGGYDVFSIDPDGGNLRPLTSLPGDELEPTVSADGQLLAWQSRSDAQYDIFVTPLSDTTHATAVTPGDADDREPHFARTSSRGIVFVSDRLGYSQIFRMAADGSGYAALSPTFGSAQYGPSPHPLVDNQLLFSTPRGGSDDVWSMSVSAIDGSVTALNQTDTLSYDDTQPDWGADASFFVYVSDEGGGRDLWLGDLTGGRRQVTSFAQPIEGPSTSPVPGSTRCAASLARSDGGSDIVIIDLVSGTIVRNLTSPEAGN